MRRWVRSNHAVQPEEVFADAMQVGVFDEQQMEGVIERPLEKRIIQIFIIFVVTFMSIFAVRLFALQIVRGDSYSALAENNRLASYVTFNERGVIFDRTGEALAWNEDRDESTPFLERGYIDHPGFGHILGFVTYPQIDKNGYYWRLTTQGQSGAEQWYDDKLVGEVGYQLSETDVFQTNQGQTVTIPPQDGENIYLSIDAQLQRNIAEKLYEAIETDGYQGGAAVVMDVHSGELHALVSAPEFDSQIMTDRRDIETIRSYFSGESGNVFLNRGIGGLYSPGSTVKPFVAIAALHERLVTKDTVINSVGKIEIPNPYDPENPSIFRDWRPNGHGPTDIYHAIADSVNTYFYSISGGFRNQQGMGIRVLSEYMELFGVAQKTNIDAPSEISGVVPTPDWKKKIFNDDWRLGDTYITSIGQFGFQVTPLQMARSIGALANDGVLLTPVLLANTQGQQQAVAVTIRPEDYSVIRNAMRQTVTQGTAQPLNQVPIPFAAKTGTAQVGVQKDFIHSWVVGFYPADDPQFSFAVVLEKGPEDARSAVSYISQAFREYFTEKRETVENADVQL